MSIEEADPVVLFDITGLLKRLMGVIDEKSTLIILQKADRHFKLKIYGGDVSQFDVLDIKRLVNSPENAAKSLKEKLEYENKNRSNLLVVILFVLIAFTVLLYAYPFSGQIRGVMTKSSVPTSTESAFLTSYGLPDNVSITSLYDVSQNNVMIISCNYAVQPTFFNIVPSLQAQNATAYGDYNTLIRDVGLYTVCSIYNDTGICGGVESKLIDYGLAHLNGTAIKSMYNESLSEVSFIYDQLVNSTLSGSQMERTAAYDKTLLDNQTNGTTAEITTALVKLRQIPTELVNLPNGTTVSDNFYLPVPFQFQYYYFPALPSCNKTLTVFNLIPDLSSFESQTYQGMLSGLNTGATNICINSSTNDCGAAPASAGVSFYVQQG